MAIRLVSPHHYFPMELSYQQADIARNLEPRFINRGFDYFRKGKVLRIIHPGPGHMKAWVAGSGRRRYELDIHFRSGEHGTIISGECSCPVGHDCKHVAAVLFAALEEQRRQAITETREDPLAEWLTKLERAMRETVEQRNQRRDYPPGERKRILYLLDVRHFGNHACTIVNPVTAYERKDGSFSRATSYAPRNVLVHQAAHVLDVDVSILRWLHTSNGPLAQHNRLEAADATDLLRALLETARARWRDPNGPVLHVGNRRRGTLGWSEPDDAGHLRPAVIV